MAVALLLVTHDTIGTAMRKTATETLGTAPLACHALAIHRRGDIEAYRREIALLATRLDDGEGLLVLTDIFGSTPSNIACTLLERPNTRVIAGVNLPMLFRIFNYASLPLEPLAQKALSGGHDGIIACDDLCYLERTRHG